MSEEKSLMPELSQEEKNRRLKIAMKEGLTRNIMVIALSIVIAGIAGLTGGKILSAPNINDIIIKNGYVFVLSAGMLLCILTGGNIDLACGSIMCFVGGIGAILMTKHVPWFIAILVMIIVGIIIGIWQGYWIAYIKVPPFIATLAGMYAFRGVSNLIMHGEIIDVQSQKTMISLFGGGGECYVPDVQVGSIKIICLCIGIAISLLYVVFVALSQNKARKQGYSVAPLTSVIPKTVVIVAVIIWVFFKLSQYEGVPTVLIWIVIILGITAYVTNKTRIGRYLYAVGGNEKATKLSGIDPRKVYMFAYVVMGAMAGFAGILALARARSAAPTACVGYEMDAIAACFIGGASAYGGEGTVYGVIIGAVLMGVINQGLEIVGWPPFWADVVKGVVLLLAIVVDVLTNKKKN